MHRSDPLIMRMIDVQRTVALSRSSIYNKINKKSRYFDHEFPKPIKIGKSAIGWIAAEVFLWVSKKSACRDEIGSGVRE